MPTPPKHLDYGVLNQLGGHLFRHAFLRGQQVFAEVFSKETITPLQFMTLELVSQNPGVTHSDICDAMASAPSVLTTMLKPLVRDGLLLRERIAGDGRRIGYRLSAEGEAWFRKIRPQIDAAEDKLFEGLAPAQREALLASLRHLTGRETQGGGND
ncbi:MarR family transcriptional regulator [Pelagibius litoralis]|uniref:MarR family transcriptional regulator n=1 Tax=Pelagibius litoralis TaxID=374515 RepID=A0A967CAG4_9PROT|nr:MarR family transcriptional regulator [Pelagibius litoralis]NIA67663.1 MarR family transcriptional regulator [Pelagibius litoralis]